MKWYYVEAGQQAGPVDDVQLEELARGGSAVGGASLYFEKDYY